MAFLRSSCLQSLADLIGETLRSCGTKRSAALPQHFTSKSKRITFSINLALVTLGIRAGYLLDTFIVAEPEIVFVELLRTLNKKSPVFKDLKLIHHANTDQCFFVNITLLTTNAAGHLQGHRNALPVASQERARLDGNLNDEIHDISDNLNQPFGILLSEVPSLLLELPASLTDTLHYIIKTLRNSENLTCRLLDDLGIQTLVPLAGFLLEYPVVYVPTSDDQSVFLPMVALDVYHCSLILTKGCASAATADHSLLKFSCPAKQSEQKPLLAPPRLKDRVETMFRERLRRIDDKWSFEMVHTVVTLDRVAL